MVGICGEKYCVKKFMIDIIYKFYDVERTLDSDDEKKKKEDSMEGFREFIVI